jgi:L-serine/L-threonine ammonia-lyase
MSISADSNTGWEEVPVLAMETVGSECFHKSLKAGSLVEITLTSIAKSLGARSVAPTLMEIHKKFNIISKVLPDKDAVSACLRFAGKYL